MEHALFEVLQLKDTCEIENIFCRNEKEQILKTLESVPRSLLPEVINLISDYLKMKQNYVPTAINWLKCVFILHGNVFHGEDLRGKIEQISTYIDKKSSLQNPLNKLKGKLDLLVYQSEQASLHPVENSETVRLDYNDLDDDHSNEELELPLTSDNNLRWKSDSEYSEEASGDEDEMEEDS